MDIDALGNSPIGQLVPITGHDEFLREFAYFAFLPDPLPDNVALSQATWAKVSEASAALGRLDQACSTLPNPRLLIAPALAREAVDTSALEGTYGALAAVLEARITEQASSPEVAEIRAYERIAHNGFDWVQERPVTMALLSDLQGILAKDSRQPQRDPGQVRQHQVVIGPQGGTVYEARFIPPPPDDRLAAGLESWVDWIEQPSTLPPVLAAAMAHYQFEALHPFGDGNGRIGRLVIVLQLLRRNELSHPSLTISPWLRKRRDVYQGHLLNVSKTGDWNPWVQFFCEAVCNQALASVHTVELLNRWMATTRSALNDRHWHGTIAKIVDALVDWPFIDINFVKANFDVSGPTAKSAVDRLVEIGILKESSGRKYRMMYAAQDVVDIVESM